MNSKSHIYLICDAATDQYKVGVTKNAVEKRIKQLQTSNGNPLHIAGVYDTDYPYYIEKMIHQELSKYNTNGEWFYIDDTNVNIITIFKSLCDKYENIVIQMKDNPFFKKMAHIK